MKITIDSNSGAFEFECAPSEAILRAGLAQGLALPYECATGTCGTCRGRVTAGGVHVDWNEAPGYAKLKREKGDILMCQARPTSDCTLRVPAKIGRHANSETLPAQRTAGIKNVRRLLQDVIDFDLALSSPMTFEAGQFVVLENPAIAGGRAYSMVNFERATSRLRIVVKQQSGGRFSEWLFGGDPTGTELGVFGPLGAATFQPEEGKDMLCVAGGSGIAGMMAILNRAVREGYFNERSGRVFFGVRTLGDAFYMEELAGFVAASADRLQVTLALSHEPVARATHPHLPSIRLAGGMVSDVMVRAMAGSYPNTVAFTAGPPVMVDAVLRHLLHEAKLPRALVRYDKFA
ncbi:MAG: 2Fe-2S iron-sulfur cluster binding domain-containing protein [Hyphomicrobiaceae bacterium]|nr:2Fe-2S iron-sulfur cluster binding domain-containing protein [Hyphomicrobiaceae bacterium]